MARTTPRPRPTATQTLAPLLRHGPTCGHAMWAAYHNYRTITTLTDVRRLTLKIRHCIAPGCPQFRHPYRPEAEGRLALPKRIGIPKPLFSPRAAAASPMASARLPRPRARDTMPKAPGLLQTTL
jgi:hypothetical protein